MPPQVQLGRQEKSGKLIKHEHWSTAEQLPVTDFRLSQRRIGPSERADGVVVFERQPYKRSMETLFLQMAESGAVDKPINQLCRPLVLESVHCERRRIMPTEMFGLPMNMVLQYPVPILSVPALMLFKLNKG